MSAAEGRIFDVQRFCTHDGPGIRTTIFTKGCPLRCAWCSNPESQSPAPQLMHYRRLCTGCGACVKACPQGAAQAGQDGFPTLARALCTACGACAEVCPAEARAISGRTAGVEELTALVREDWRYYMHSGGGVTVSGGEALSQPKFVHALLTRLHDGLGYHSCIETCGYAPWQVLESLLPLTDLVIFDIKHMDPAEHERMIGADNKLILENAAKLGDMGIPTLIRVPLIPGFNDTEANLRALWPFLKRHRLQKLEIMPYHALGDSKYEALGLPYHAIEAKPDVELALNILTSYGIEAAVHE